MVTYIKKEKTDLLSITGLLIMGFLCLAYVLYGPKFAEKHIMIKRMDLPVFVSEWTLLCVSVIAAVKLYTLRWKWNKHGMILILLVIFILSKTIAGYAHTGNLALRHGAVFSYFLFAVSGYVFYKPDILGKESFHNFITLLLIFLLTQRIGYFLLAIGFIALAFIVRLPNRLNRWVAYGFFALVFPFPELFAMGRGGNISSIAAMLFFAVMTAVVASNFRKYWVVWVAGSISMMCAFFITSSRSELTWFLEPKYLMREMSIRSEFFERNRDNFHFNSCGVKVFKPNRSQSFLLPDNKQESLGYSLENVSKARRDEIFSNPTPRVVEGGEGKGIELVPLKQSRLLDIILKAIQPLSVKKTLAIPESTKTSFREEYGTQGESSEGESRLSTVLWRLFLWEDIFEDWTSSWYSIVLGKGFGVPLRSRRLEMMGWYAGQDVGWLEAHNFFLTVIYRCGLMGVLALLYLFCFLLKLLQYTVERKSIALVLLLSALVYWLTFCNFQVCFEVPYFAIPFWSLLGVIYAYADTNKSIPVPELDLNLEKRTR